MPRTTIAMDGRAFTIRPPTIGLLKRIVRFHEEQVGMSVIERADAITDLLFNAIRRAHPDLTRAELEDLLDEETIQSATDALLGAAGLVKASPGEAVSP